MRMILFVAAVLAIGGTVKADTFVNGERYEPGMPVAVPADACDAPAVAYVSASACSQAQSACSSQSSASACGSSASAKSARTGPVRRLFGRLFRGRSGCGG